MDQLPPDSPMHTHLLRIPLLTILGLWAAACTMEVDPTPTLAPALSRVAPRLGSPHPNCQLDGVVEHFSFDESLPERGRNGQVLRRPLEPVDSQEFERDCPGGRTQDYLTTQDVYAFPACSTQVYDHLLTLHTAAQLCQRGELENRNLHLSAGCRRGGCVYLDCFMDPLKFKCDPAGNTPVLELGTEATITAWVKPDMSRSPWGEQQRLVRTDGLNLGFILNDSDTLVLLLDLGRQKVTSPVITRTPTELERFLFLAATVQIESDHTLVGLYLDGEPVHQERVDRDTEALPTLSTRLQGMGGGLCGTLDETTIYSRVLSDQDLMEASEDR